MTSIIVSIFLISMSQYVVTIIIDRHERSFVSYQVLKAWFILIPVLIIVHLKFPFIGGHDDQAYYEWSATSLRNINDIFDLTRFSQDAQQPGYLWLLSVVNFIFGQNLFVYKMINLFFFIVLIPIWYRIGSVLETQEYGNKVAQIFIYLTPLWFYSFFVLKDMVIVLLQSLFVLGMILNTAENRIKHWALIIISTILIIPFRTQLLLINVGVISGASIVLAIKTRQRKKIIIMALSAITVYGMLYISTNSDYMSKFGIYSIYRVIGTQEFVDVLKSNINKMESNIVAFTIKYFLSETSGLNVSFYENFTAYTLRGMLAIPWILLGVPFFVKGLVELFKKNNSLERRTNRLASTTAFTPAWSIILIYLMGYFFLSLIAGDTTRYRMPDIPVLAIIAVFGWISSSAKGRAQILELWVISTLSLYSLLKMYEMFT